MLRAQFDSLQATLQDANLYGKFIGLTLVSDNGFNAGAKREGWKKVTVYNLQVPKKGYYEIVNTSTGAADAGVEVKQLRKSHYEWVDNRRAWSGVSKYLQESIEPVVNWRGIRLPEPTPQNCNRAELTEYGPADFTYFVTQQRLRTGDPVVNPKEMAGCFRSSIGLGTGGGSCGGMGCEPLGFGFFGF